METVGSIQVVATMNTRGYDSGKKHVEQGNQELEGNAKKTSKGFSAAWTGAIAGAVAAVVNKGMSVISNSIDGAIKRVDTLNNSARTFENMGIKAVDSSKAMKALEKSITGLPTPLDSAVRGMTALTATYGDIDKGQKVFSALNNAILGFGGSSAMVDNAITQLSQLPMDGPLDAQTWNSLRNSGITPVLTAMAKDSGMSVSEMKEAFGEGELTVQDFTDKLLKLDKEGGGGLTSLEKIAKDSTKGIGTGFSNMQTAVTRGVASIIEGIGSENISNAITSVGKAFETSLKAISGTVNFIKNNSEVFSTLAVAIGAAGTAVVLYSGYVKAAAVVTAAYSAVSSYLTLVMSLQAQGLGVARAAWVALNIAMRANPIGIIITALIAVTAALVYFFTQTKTGKAIITNVFGFIKNFIGSVAKFISTAFTKAWTTIKTVWNAARGFFTGIWTGIKNVFNTVSTWFRSKFQAAWTAIKNVFSPVGRFFAGIWTTIKNKFSSVGRSVGNAIGGAFRGAINGVLRFAGNQINGLINNINNAVGVINKIPGVNIPRISNLAIPQLATGGITTGPTLAMIGEGREQEAVLPLSKLDALLSNSGGDSKSNSIHVDTIIIEKDVDIDLVARKLGINQLQTRRGIA